MPVSGSGRFPRTPHRGEPAGTEHRGEYRRSVHPLPIDPPATEVAGKPVPPPATEVAGKPVAPPATEVAGKVVPVHEVSDDDAWMLQGSCRGAQTRAFFPSDGSGVDAAQRVCRECPVRQECLEYALRHRIEQGVWGGASERERRRILRQRRRAGAFPG